jgi:tRNA(Ile)-lysidine synthase TilS/MesJ
MGHKRKQNEINWESRKAEFISLVKKIKSESTTYDCIVPVSGGKDSWYQVIKAKEYGLNVLAVTWRTHGRTAVGQKNLEKLIEKLSVDHIEYTISPDVEKRFTKVAFEETGVSGLPMHMAIFTIPLRLASQMRVPLVIWGENPQL